jgi:hypothetical protein
MTTNLKYGSDPDEFYNSEIWLEIRQDILDRDDHECRVCGSTNNLQVHHIVPRKFRYSTKFDIDSELNLITLCGGMGGCHEKADRKVNVYGVPVINIEVAQNNKLNFTLDKAIRELFALFPQQAKQLERLRQIMWKII